MFDRIIRWSIANRLLVLAAAGVLLVTGAITALRMPVDVFPDLTAPTVTVGLLRNPLPVMVIVVPPAVAPVLGLTAEMVGGRDV